MNSYKDYRFCSNCKIQGSLKYIGHVWNGSYICRGCWDQINEVERKMKRSITPNKYDNWTGWMIIGCEG